MYKFITSLIELPYSKKSYLDLIEYLKSHGKDQEASAFSHLIELRFPKNVINDSFIDKK
jgi:hypothetical protein